MRQLPARLCVYLGIVGFSAAWALGLLAGADVLAIVWRALAASAVLGVLGFAIGRTIFAAVVDELAEDMAKRAKDSDAANTEEAAA